MTEEEYKVRRDKYRKKELYYRRKRIDLEIKYFNEVNKDNDFTKSMCCCLPLRDYIGERIEDEKRRHDHLQERIRPYKHDD